MARRGHSREANIKSPMLQLTFSSSASRPTAPTTRFLLGLFVGFLLFVPEPVIGSVIALRDGHSSFLVQSAVLHEFGLLDRIRRNVEGNSMH
jgi:hypothetical protein